MEPAPPTVDAALRQVGRVRWRHNLHEIQRTLYLLVATAAATGAVLLLLALRAPLAVFVAGGSGALAAGLATGAVLVRDLRRRWLTPAAAPLWIDARAGLGGQLATLIELHARGDTARRPFLLPLLEQLNAARLATWLPERLLPTDVPLGPFAAGAAALAGLVLVLALAPALRPPVVELLPDDGGLAPLESGWRARATERLVGGERLAAAGTHGDAGPASLATPGDPEEGQGSPLARLAGSLQERVRERFWGAGWIRMREALARAARTRQSGGRREQAGAGDEDGEGADVGRAIARAAPERATSAGAAGSDPGADGTARGAAGAGTGTDPELEGPELAGGGSDDGFELALPARVRAERPAGRSPSGPPPPAAPDARPALAMRQQREAAIHRPAVPPAYEAIVGALFAGGTPAAGAAP